MGYYARSEAASILGSKGDFVTSPEMTQIFGESVGLWVHTVCAARSAKPQPWRIVELGPGNGTLMDDVLRTLNMLPDGKRRLEQCHVSLVESSPHLRDNQRQRLARFHDGVASVSWHAEIADVPHGVPTIVIAHEFLDALPTHVFRRQERDGAWREVLVDVDDRDGDADGDGDGGVDHGVDLDVAADAPSAGGFRYVVAPGATAASAMLLPRRLAAMDPSVRDRLRSVEISGKAMAACVEVTRRLRRDGGAALFVDYGRGEPYEASVRAIKAHRQVHPLAAPALSADLSACVDFGAMALATASANEEVSDEYRHGVRFHGPVPQSDFLHALGAGERARHLVSACGDDESAARRVYDGYRRVVETADEVASAGGDRGDAMGDAFVAATLVSDDVACGDDAVVSAALSLAEARGAPVRGCFENNKL